jgi:hypothetical protein
VHQEFGELFAMKIMIYVHELLSVVLTPFVLWLSLPDCAPAIVDFFREFTIHVDSLGYVCSFAVFDFQRHGNVKVSPDLVLVPLSSIGIVFSPGYPILSLPQDLRFLAKSLGYAWSRTDGLNDNQSVDGRVGP